MVLRKLPSQKITRYCAYLPCFFDLDVRGYDMELQSGKKGIYNEKTIWDPIE
jgi:hypothetical protein